MCKEDALVDTPPSNPAGRPLPKRADVEVDIDAILAALGLQKIRRYMGQKHWTEESMLARAADEAEPGLKLENVAAHSWHVADATLLLAPHFPDVNVHRALELAVLHDKLEMLTGDFDPVGDDGQGMTSHAFNSGAQREKVVAELAALDRYLAEIREPTRERQRLLLLDIIDMTSNEARFVMAVDKLQAFAFVLAKKEGAMTDDHLAFSIRFYAKLVEYYPALAMHYSVLVRRLLESVANHRRTTVEQLVAGLPSPAQSIVEASLV